MGSPRMDVLTYYTVVCFWSGRKPIIPFQSVKYLWFVLALGVAGLHVSTAMSIVTIERCRNTWQLLVIELKDLDLESGKLEFKRTRTRWELNQSQAAKTILTMSTYKIFAEYYQTFRCVFHFNFRPYRICSWCTVGFHWHRHIRGWKHLP